MSTELKKIVSTNFRNSIIQVCDVKIVSRNRYNHKEKSNLGRNRKEKSNRRRPMWPETEPPASAVAGDRAAASAVSGVGFGRSGDEVGV